MYPGSISSKYENPKELDLDEGKIVKPSTIPAVETEEFILLSVMQSISDDNCGVNKAEEKGKRNVYSEVSYKQGVDDDTEYRELVKDFASSEVFHELVSGVVECTACVFDQGKPEFETDENMEGTVLMFTKKLGEIVPFAADKRRIECEDNWPSSNNLPGISILEMANENSVQQIQICRDIQEANMPEPFFETVHNQCFDAAFQDNQALEKSNHEFDAPSILLECDIQNTDNMLVEDMQYGRILSLKSSMNKYREDSQIDKILSQELNGNVFKEDTENGRVLSPASTDNIFRKDTENYITLQENLTLDVAKEINEIVSLQDDIETVEIAVNEVDVKRATLKPQVGTTIPVDAQSSEHVLIEDLRNCRVLLHESEENMLLEYVQSGKIMLKDSKEVVHDDRILSQESITGNIFREDAENGRRLFSLDVACFKEHNAEETSASFVTKNIVAEVVVQCESRFQEENVRDVRHVKEPAPMAPVVSSESFDTDMYEDARESLGTCSISGISFYYDAETWNQCSGESIYSSIKNGFQDSRMEREDCNPPCGGLNYEVKDNYLHVIPRTEQEWRAPSSRTWEVQSVSTEAEEILIHTKHEEVDISNVNKPHTPLRRLLAEAQGQEDKYKVISGGSRDRKNLANGWDSDANGSKPKTRSVWSHCICCA